MWYLYAGKVVENVGTARYSDAADGRPAFCAKGTVVNFVVKYIKRLVPNTTCQMRSRFAARCSMATVCSMSSPRLSLKIWLSLQYTGGTTGVAKGAMLTHRNMLANLEQVKATMGRFCTGKSAGSDRAAAVSHFALTVNCLLLSSWVGKTC